MATPSFTPIESLDAYCRFCNKVVSVQLDRSIAETGKTVSKKGTFEYACPKCKRTFCVSGGDVLEKNDTEEDAPKEDVREYTPSDHYLIGETIFHKKFKDTGKVVGKDKGSTTKILVEFEKSGITKLVEDL